jgi:hypothetical protein
MSNDCEEVWSTLPEWALHAARVPIVEALQWIGEPLSAIELVDVLDGYLSVWELAYHLRVLDALDVVERSTVDNGASGEGRLYVSYCLKDRKSGKGA